jgi:hypothetical protein
LVLTDQYRHEQITVICPRRQMLSRRGKRQRTMNGKRLNRARDVARTVDA